MTFNDELLEAIGNWQRGWRENQEKRMELAEQIKKATAALPIDFRTVSCPCFRKRFLHKGELVDILMRNEKSEGVTSWTTDKRFAERFKGLIRDDAISAAIFEHTPTPEEVVVNIPALWTCPEFVDAAERYKQKGSIGAIALFHFKDTQKEIVLETPLRGSDIVALSAVSSPFDELCDKAGIPEDERDGLFKKLVDDKIPVGEPVYISKGGVKNVLEGTLKAMWDKIRAAKK